jgi:hypothetical protein
MKKSTVKAAKTTATPAKKTADKIVKKPAASAIKAPAKKTVAPVVAPVAKPVVKPAAKLAPTVIHASIDIGFGNTLYVRGEGAGLSWDAGIAMECVSDDQWSLSLPGTSKAITYKLLVNDLSWSIGPDYVAEPGSSVSLTPTF